MNLAILIDAENVLPAHADLIFSHAQSLGEIRHKEIFGAAQALGSWVEPVLKYAIHPNLTIRATKGKNTSDIALVIGAMDLLVAGDVDGVIIASSDSDFSGLSVRLRNAGMEVIGMGTEKSNPLWRTACSSFVVLQQPQAGKPAPKAAAKPAAQAQDKPAEAPKPAKAAGSTHAERAALIREFIEKRLQSNGGRLQTGTIFTALNRLSEYRVDKQGSGKKPLNYLTSTFSDAFRFEETPDGKSWISLPGVEPLPMAAEAAPADDAASEPAEAVEPAEPVEAEAVEPAAETAEPATEAAEPAAEAPSRRRSRRRGGSRKAPATEASTAGEAAEAPAEAKALATPDGDYYVDEVPQQDGPDPLALLMDAGLPEDVAQQIVVIFTESDSLRAAYNRLRSTFGATAGREYYQKVKEIASAQG